MLHFGLRFLSTLIVPLRPRPRVCTLSTVDDVHQEASSR